MTAKDIADRFRKMADRIERNADEPFGGVMLVIPPGDEPSVIELLKLDPTPDATSFWAELKGRCDEAVHDLSSAARNSQAGFRR